MKESPRTEITTAEELIEEEIEELERGTVHHWTTWLLAIGALIVLTAVLTMFFFMNKPMNFGPRTETGLAILTLAEPQGQSIGAPERFRWAPFSGAAKYIVTVVEDRTGRTVLSRPVEPSALEPTSEEAASFTPGLYSWSVEAIGATGNPIAQGEGAFVVSGTRG